MKRSLLPSFCALLLVGCGAAERKTAFAQNVETKGAATSTPPPIPAPPAPATNAVFLAVRPPQAPPELPAPVQEVVRLAQTTLSEGVLVDYIAVIKEPFSLDADQVIYLNDLGVPMTAIQALLKRSTATAATAGVAPRGSVIRPGSSAPALAATSAAAFAPPAPAVTVAPAEGAPPPPPTAAPVVVSQPATTVTYNTFYETLSPYGSWVEVPGAGWCWRPSVAVVDANWQPYGDGGAWVWSDCGWYWRSSYSWGWAPFHYGRWHRAVGFGWCWTPDYQWAPAWVTWRSSGAHCGWAPLPPSCGWTVGVGLTWRGGRAAFDCDFGLGFDSFVYVGWNRFCDPSPWRHRLGRTEIASVHTQTRVVNDIRGNNNTGVNVVGNNNTVIINNGPGLDPVQKHTRGEITKARLVDSPDAGRASASRGAGTAAVLPVYRPTINASASGARPAPSTALLARQERGVNSAIAGGPSSGAQAGAGRPGAINGSSRGEVPVARSANPATSPSPRGDLGISSGPAGAPVIGGRGAGSPLAATPARPATATAGPDRSPSPGAPTIIGRGTGALVQERSAAPATPGRPQSYPGGRSQPEYVPPVTTIPQNPAPNYTTGPSVPRAQVSRGETPKLQVPTARQSAPEPQISEPQPVQAPVVGRPSPTYNAQPSGVFRNDVARPSQGQESGPARVYQAPAGAAAPGPSFTPPPQYRSAPERSYSPPAQRSGPPPSPANGGGGASRPTPGHRDTTRPN
ncbi:MAG: DUF6600 domain-containing protein [Verrucomicrobiota bacterium]